MNKRLVATKQHFCKLGKAILALVLTIGVIIPSGFLTAKEAKAESAGTQYQWEDDNYGPWGYIYPSKNGQTNEVQMVAKIWNSDSEGVFCIQRYVTFATGTHTGEYVTGDYWKQLALFNYWVDNVYSYQGLDKQYVKQLGVWYITGEIYGNTNFSGVYVSDFISQFDSWYGENKDLYDYWCIRWSYGSSQQTITTNAWPATGYANLLKVSGNSSITNDNNCYSLENAVYGVYDSAEKASAAGTFESSDEAKAADDGRSTTLITSKDGTVKSEGLLVGTYYIKELCPSKGYYIDDNIYPVEIKSRQTAEVTVTEVPGSDPVKVLLSKFDGEKVYAAENLPTGSASLEGAEFTVFYYDGQYTTKDEATASGEPTRTWVYRTALDGIVDISSDKPISGDSLYIHDNVNVFPIGTYVIEETKAPSGYEINSKPYIRNVTLDGIDVGSINTTNRPAIPEQVYRSDLKFQKKDGETGKPIQTAFQIESKTTGEKHIIVTDENGMFDSRSLWNQHTNNTNGNDQFLDATDAVDVEELDSTAGVWFGVGTEPNDALKAFPYDTYSIQELRTTTNQGLNLVTFDFSVSRDLQDYDYGTVDDNVPQQIQIRKVNASNATQVRGATLLLEKKNSAGDWEEYATTVTTDEEWTVEADPGQYRLTETITPKDYEQAESIEFTVSKGEVVKYVEMKDVPIEISGETDKRQTLVEKDDEGNGSYIYTIDYRSTSSTWADEFNFFDEINCAKDEFATLEYVNTPVVQGDYDGLINVWYKTNKTDPAFSDDANVYNACITNPYNEQNPNNTRIQAFTGWRIWKASVSSATSSTLKVSELSLTEGEYVVAIAIEHGRVDANMTTQTVDNQWSRTNHYFADDAIDTGSDDYLSLTTDKTTGIVKATHADGLAPVVLGMSVSKDVLENDEVVLSNKTNIDIHRNNAVEYSTLNDDDEDRVEQGVPSIKTNAVDTTDGDQEIFRSKTCSVTDKVTYKNLIPGKEYEIRGTLMKKKTEKALIINDKEVTDIKTFIPNASTGAVELTFQFDSSSLNDGDGLVAFEELYLDGKFVAAHKDINDAAQTVMVVNPTTPGKYYDKTGADITDYVPLITSILALALAGFGCYFVKRSGYTKKNKTE